MLDYRSTFVGIKEVVDANLTEERRPQKIEGHGESLSERRGRRQSACQAPRSRRAISATSVRASTNLSILDSGCRPSSSSTVISLTSLPGASCARFATISGNLLRRLFAPARRTTSWLSAVEPD